MASAVLNFSSLRPRPPVEIQVPIASCNAHAAKAECGRSGCTSWQGRQSPCAPSARLHMNRVRLTRQDVIAVTAILSPVRKQRLVSAGTGGTANWHLVQLRLLLVNIRPKFLRLPVTGVFDPARRARSVQFPPNLALLRIAPQDRGGRNNGRISIVP